ncbi:class I SAM-dependent methyltransferase [Yimella sp. cx-573]|nr:class I SAM-dependent methyltransferase [Yimella sp. cx-573]
MVDRSDPAPPPAVGRHSREVDDAESSRAQRAWWDAEAADYYAEHGAFLGDDQLVWGPEGWTEDELQLLGPLADQDVLEFGAGAAQGARWVSGQGARVVATDISLGMLEVGRRIDQSAGRALAMAQADAGRLPFGDGSFDLAFSAYGAVPFIADTRALMRELARVLRPGGRLVFSTTHPIRWVFPDVPDAGGLVAQYGYFDTSPYVEQTEGVVTYVEHHRTIGARIRELVAAGLVVTDVVEPQWPERNDQEWGGWSPLRGKVIPGTAIYVATKPAR